MNETKARTSNRLKHEKNFVCLVVEILDGQFGENSETAKWLAADIATAAKNTGNIALAQAMERVADNYREE